MAREEKLKIVKTLDKLVRAGTEEIELVTNNKSSTKKNATEVQLSFLELSDWPYNKKWLAERNDCLTKIVSMFGITFRSNHNLYPRWYSAKRFSWGVEEHENYENS